MKELMTMVRKNLVM